LNSYDFLILKTSPKGCCYSNLYRRCNETTILGRPTIKWDAYVRPNLDEVAKEEREREAAKDTQEEEWEEEDEEGEDDEGKRRTRRRRNRALHQMLRVSP